jgi:hypothetical protein
LLKKFLSASATAITSWQDVTLSSLCSGVKECETKHAHNFLSQILFQNPKNYSLGDVHRFCYHSWCDSTVIFDQISIIMFTTVRVDFGQPPLLSSSTGPLPPRNWECHLITFDRLRASIP